MSGHVAIRRAALLACALATAACGFAQAPERPGTPVFSSGAWFVVRAGACIGYSRTNPHVELNTDRLTVRMQQDAISVTHALDGQPMPPHRAFTDAEKKLRALALTGAELARLANGKTLRIETLTAGGSPVRHEVDLQGLAAALENIRAGCPASGQPVRGSPRS